MTRQLEIGRQRVEEQSERGQHEHTDELTYVLESARHVESSERGFIEAYRDVDLRLELYFRVADDELSGKFGQDPAIVYGFRGAIGLKDSTIWCNELPDELGIQCANGKHVVLVAIGQRVQVQERVSILSLGLHVIRLEPIDNFCGALGHAVEASFPESRREIVRLGADRELMLKAGGVAVSFDQFFDKVVEGGSQIVDNVTGNGGEFERWLTEHLEAETSVCAVIAIALGSDRSVRSASQVRQRCRLQPMHVLVSVP